MTDAWKRYAGLTVAPAAWAVTTQLGQILSYADCNGHISWSLAATALGAALAVAGTLLSSLGQKGTNEHTALFEGYLSVGVGLAFTFALLLQGTATLLLNACQH
jgi:hypothetical protein